MHGIFDWKVTDLYISLEDSGQQSSGCDSNADSSSYSNGCSWLQVLIVRSFAILTLCIGP